jgi:hypothetical protein
MQRVSAVLPLMEVCDDWYAARGATIGETGWARSCSRERWLGEGQEEVTTRRDNQAWVKTGQVCWREL